MIKKINLILPLVILIFLFLLITIYLIISITNKKMINEKPQPQPQEMDQNTVSRNEIITEDGVTIVGDYYQKQESKFAGILIHMMPADRKSFSYLALKLQEAGYSSLAIDLRGHGESTKSLEGNLDYRDFSDKQHQDSIYDLKAASKFLEKEGFPIQNQFLIGASIGANLSLQFLSQYPEIKAVVLLSPGLNYRGIQIENYLSKEIGDKLMVVVTKDDTQSYSATNLIKNLAPSSTIIEYEGSLHGTDIFKDFPDLYQKILLFLRERLL